MFPHPLLLASRLNHLSPPPSPTWSGTAPWSLSSATWSGGSNRHLVASPTPNRPPSFPLDPSLPLQVERYGSLEFSIRDLVGLVRSDRHAAVDDAELDRIEREISDMILRLGLQAQDPETFSWRGAYEAASVTLKKALQVRVAAVGAWKGGLGCVREVKLVLVR